MTDKLKQQGFSAIAVVTALVIITSIVGASWYVFKQNRPETSGAIEPNGSQTTDSNQPATGDSEPTVAYLEIEEWGIKAPLSDEIKDAYVVSGGSSEGFGRPSTRLWLGLRSFNTEKCNPENNNKGGRGAIGAYLRFTPDTKDEVTGRLLTEMLPNGTTIGDYYYAYQSWKRDNPCISGGQLENIDNAFALSAKNFIAATTGTE